MQKIILNTPTALTKNTSASHAKELERTTRQARLMRLTPWLAGAGIAIGHVLTSANCSIPKQGSCSACGSCVVALGSLTAWALIKQRNSTQPFYEQSTKN